MTSRHRAPAPSTRGRPRNQPATVYDAVAGRVFPTCFINKDLGYTATCDTPSISDTDTSSPSATHAPSSPVAGNPSKALPPEAVLFRRKDAPPRYAEDDIYFANESHPHPKLPDSDLLKALHHYASDFYSRAAPASGEGVWESLDGTALIALGILMEEASHLRGAADLALTEGAETIGDLS